MNLLEAAVRSPEMTEFAKNHNLDLNPNGSTFSDLLIEILKAINKLEAEK